MKIKSTKFQTKKVLKQTRAHLDKAVIGAAAFGRTVAMRSMKKRKAGNAAQPGSPPHSHKRKGQTRTFKDFIRFAEDRRPFGFKGAVIGPTATHWAEEIGNTHEFGGTVTRQVNFTIKGKSVRQRDSKGRFLESKRTGDKKVSQRRTMKYPKRPFMQPALVKAQEKFAQLAGRVGGE